MLYYKYFKKNAKISRVLLDIPDLGLVFGHPRENAQTSASDRNRSLARIYPRYGAYVKSTHHIVSDSAYDTNIYPHNIRRLLLLPREAHCLGFPELQRGSPSSLLRPPEHVISLSASAEARCRGQVPVGSACGTEHGHRGPPVSPGALLSHE